MNVKPSWKQSWNLAFNYTRINHGQNPIMSIRVVIFLKCGRLSQPYIGFSTKWREGQGNVILGMKETKCFQVESNKGFELVTKAKIWKGKLFWKNSLDSSALHNCGRMQESESQHYQFTLWMLKSYHVPNVKEKILKVSPHSQFGDQKHNLWKNRRLDMNKTMEIMKFGNIIVPTIKDISIYFFHSKFIPTYFFSHTSSPHYLFSIFQIFEFWISLQYPTLHLCQWKLAPHTLTQSQQETL